MRSLNNTELHGPNHRDFLEWEYMNAPQKEAWHDFLVHKNHQYGEYRVSGDRVKRVDDSVFAMMFCWHYVKEYL